MKIVSFVTSVIFSSFCSFIESCWSPAHISNHLLSQVLFIGPFMPIVIVSFHLKMYETIFKCLKDN